MPPKQHREIAMQFGGRVPKNAVVIEPLGNGQGVHWLSDNAGLKARIREAIRERERKKKLARFHAEHDQSDHGNWADEWPDDTVQVWHGTPASRLNGIIKEGIVTGKFNNWNFVPEGEMEKEVFVARHPMTAANFGEEAARRAGEDEYAVIEARIPKTEPMAKDTRALVNAWSTAKVKHEWLVGAKIYKRGFRKGGMLPPPTEEIKIHENEYVTVYIPLPAAYARQLVKKFHLPDDHDQSSHGNWAKDKGVESQAFKNWFGNSKIVDKSGKPLIVYHGTTADFDEFRKGQRAWFTNDPHVADIYATQNPKAEGVLEGSKVMPLYVAIQNPFYVQPNEDARWAWAKIQDYDLERRGHDGVILLNEDGTYTGYPFTNRQIKSAFNTGSWKWHDPRISYSRRYHLPGEHDQLDHGNWADGEKSNVSQLPDKVRKEFLNAEEESLANDYETATIAFSNYKGAAGHKVLSYRGDETSVDFSDDVMALMKRDGNVIMTHNHPTGSFGKNQTVAGLSLQDIKLAARVNMREIRAVVRHESGDYVFSMARPSGGWPSRFEMESFMMDNEVFGKAVSAAKARIAAAPEENKAHLNRQNNLALSHLRAKLLAKEFGLKYRMVKISDKNVRA